MSDGSITRAARHIVDTCAPEVSTPATTKALATAATSLDDLILVAPPGMGKTTTLFQIAESVLANGTGTPLVVQLGDWATEHVGVLASVLNRPAFRGCQKRISGLSPSIAVCSCSSMVGTN